MRKQYEEGLLLVTKVNLGLELKKDSRNPDEVPEDAADVPPGGRRDAPPRYAPWQL